MVHVEPLGLRDVDVGLERRLDEPSCRADVDRQRALARAPVPTLEAAEPTQNGGIMS